MQSILKKASDLNDIVEINGKYKGKTIAEMMVDTNYVEWLQNQDWFRRKHPNVHNLIVSIQSGAAASCSSKTPVHNRLQNLFLGQKFKTEFMDYIADHIIDVKTRIQQIQKTLGCYSLQQNLKISDMICILEFEAENNWDVYIKTECCRGHFNLQAKEQGIQSLQIDPNSETAQYNAAKIENYLTQISSMICDEIFSQSAMSPFGKREKPLVSEQTSGLADQAAVAGSSHMIECVERKKKEIACYLEFESENNFLPYIEIFPEVEICIEIKPTVSDEYPNILRKMKMQIKKMGFKENCVFILLVEHFSAESCTTDQLIEIFAQSSIHVIFLKDIKSASSETKSALEKTEIDELEILRAENKRQGELISTLQSRLNEKQDEILILSHRLNELSGASNDPSIANMHPQSHSTKKRRQKI
jgi:hypothetical protein